MTQNQEQLPVDSAVINRCARGCKGILAYRKTTFKSDEKKIGRKKLIKEVTNSKRIL